jgi:hypothetical protein
MLLKFGLQYVIMSFWPMLMVIVFQELWKLIQKTNKHRLMSIYKK